MEIVIDREKWDKLTDDEKFENANKNIILADKFETSLLKVIDERNTYKNHIKKLRAFFDDIIDK